MLKVYEDEKLQGNIKYSGFAHILFVCDTEKEMFHSPIFCDLFHVIVKLKLIQQCVTAERGELVKKNHICFGGII